MATDTKYAFPSFDCEDFDTKLFGQPILKGGLVREPQGSISFYARLHCHGMWVAIGGAPSAVLDGDPNSGSNSIFQIRQRPAGPSERLSKTWIKSISENRYLRVANHMAELIPDAAQEGVYNRVDATFIMRTHPNWLNDEAGTEEHLFTTNIRSALGSDEHRIYVWGEQDLEDGVRFHLRANRTNPDHSCASFRIYDVR